MLNHLVIWYVARRKRKAIASIRATFAAFGHDLSDFSDEEVEKGMRRVSGNLSHLGFSVNEAHKSMTVVANWGKVNTSDLSHSLRAE